MMQKDLSKFQEQLIEALKGTMADTQHVLRSILVKPYDRNIGYHGHEEVYIFINQVFGPKTGTIIQIRSKDSNKSDTSSDKIFNRWKEYFSELLNKKS